MERREITPLLRAMPTLRQFNLGTLATKLYFPPPITIAEANDLPWSVFNQATRTSHVAPLYPNSDIEYCITAKPIPWSRKDLNIFTGSDNRVIRTLDDLTETEAEAFLHFNFRLAQGLISPDDFEVHVSIGFNAQDTQPASHSIKEKLHSNLYVADSSQHREERVSVQWENLTTFDRLCFVEPFSRIYHDYLLWRVGNGLFKDQLTEPEIEENLGYSSVYFKDIESILSAIPQIYQLFSDMKIEYEEAESVFTNRNEESETGFLRYIPLLYPEISGRLERFLEAKADWISEDSAKLMRYLASHIRIAKPRSSLQGIITPEQLWIAKGFSGVINFVFRNDDPTVRFDFLPRIITTSTSTKITSKKDYPTLIIKSGEPPTDEEQAEMEEFQRQAVLLATKLTSAS